MGDDKKIHPNYIFHCINSLIKKDYIGIADGGDILSFARVGLNSKYYLDSGVFGCLGVGIPYAIAASEVFKDLPIVCVTGDGSFGFNAMELDTAVRNNSNICIIISNNAGWNIESYARMAEGLGAYGIRVEKPDDLEKSIDIALKNTPSVVDVVTSSSVLSSDAVKGLGFVPKYQALDIWDNLEKNYRDED